MSEQPANKPDVGLKSQEDIKLTVSEDCAIDCDANSAADVSEGVSSAERAAISASNSGSSDVLQRSEETVHETAKKVSREGFSHSAPADNQRETNVSAFFEKRSFSPSLRRHQMIVAGCAILSLGLLCVSAMDLRYLIGRDVSLSENMKVTILKDRPSLPSGFTYAEAPNWEEDGALFDSTSNTDSKLFKVYRQTWGGRGYGLADSQGRIAVQPEFGSLGDISDGLIPAITTKAMYQPTDSETHKRVSENNWGYIDATGKFVIPPKFSNAHSFKNGVAIATVDGLSGLIDNKGNWIVRPAFNNMFSVGKNFVVSNDRGKRGMISATGKWLLQPIYGAINNLDNGVGYYNSPIRNASYSSSELDESAKFFKIFLSEKNLYGVIDADGKIMLPAEYDDVLSFHNNVAQIKVAGKVGFVTPDGKAIIKPIYSECTPYDDIMAVREAGEGWKFIDKFGKPINRSPVDELVTSADGVWMHDGLGAFLDHGKVGYMNTSGKTVIEPTFKFGAPFLNGYAPVWVGDGWKFIDKQGNFVKDIFLEELSSFREGRARAVFPGLFYRLVESQKFKSVSENIKQFFSSKERQHVMKGRY